MMQRRFLPSAFFMTEVKATWRVIGQPVLGIVLRCLGVHSGVRPEIGHAEGLAVAFEPVAQDVERALELQLLR